MGENVTREQRKEKKNKEIFIMYGFMVFVWFCRIIITIIDPWPFEPITSWVTAGQQIGSFVIFLLLLIPFVYLWKINCRTRRNRIPDITLR
jgi:hypothetical protein